MKTTRICGYRNCGIEFIAYRKNSVYCCSNCYNEEMKIRRQIKNKENPNIQANRASKYWENNKDKVAKKSREWKNSFSKEEWSLYNRRINLKRHYSLTLEEYDKLSQQSDNKCYICEKEETAHRKGQKFQLAVDHCHVTKKVRGLLCMSCNQALGLFKDNEAILEKAIQYLKKSK